MFLPVYGRFSVPWPMCCHVSKIPRKDRNCLQLTKKVISKCWLRTSLDIQKPQLAHEDDRHPRSHYSACLGQKTCSSAQGHLCLAHSYYSKTKYSFWWGQDWQVLQNSSLSFFVVKVAIWTILSATILTIHLQNVFFNPDWNSRPPLSSNFPFSLPQPQASTALLSVSINSPTLSTYRSGLVQHLSFCVWLLPLSIMSLKLIHIVAGVRIPFLFKTT